MKWKFLPDRKMLLGSLDNKINSDDVDVYLLSKSLCTGITREHWDNTVSYRYVSIPLDLLFELLESEGYTVTKTEGYGP